MKAVVTLMKHGLGLCDRDILRPLSCSHSDSSEMFIDSGSADDFSGYSDSTMSRKLFNYISHK